jgi:hypothetical protein
MNLNDLRKECKASQEDIDKLFDGAVPVDQHGDFPQAATFVAQKMINQDELISEAFKLYKERVFRKNPHHQQ